MTNKQPEALRLAELLELAPEDGIEPQTTEDAAAKLRRLHSENETLRVERERNLNSIRVCNEIINNKNAELESLRTGYAAARLEIESLRARHSELADDKHDSDWEQRWPNAETPASEYPAAPEGVAFLVEYGGDVFTLDQMRAFADATCAMRAAQPAGAQQTGADYVALADKLVRGSVACGSDGEWVSVRRHILDEFADALAASHGQAPAQAAPQQEAQEPFAWHVCSVNSDGTLSLEHAATWEEAAHEHINDSITEFDIEGAGSWVVRPAYHAPQPFPAPQADSQPAPDEIINMAREQGLPETETEGVFRVNVDDLGRVFAAYRAARTTADSVTAPAAYSGNLEQELAMLIRRIVSSARRNCEDGSNVLKLANEAWTYLVRKGLNGSPLRDAGIESDPTPPAQAAPQPSPASQGGVLDAAFEAVRHRLCGIQRYSFVLDDDGVVRRVQDRTGNWIEFDDAHALFDPVAVDAARKQGVNHD